jgi:hypothetical protein
MKELAGEMLPIFQAADVHREALAALAVFQQAAAREAATKPASSRSLWHFSRTSPALICS